MGPTYGEARYQLIESGENLAVPLIMLHVSTAIQGQANMGTGLHTL